MNDHNTKTMKGKEMKRGKKGAPEVDRSVSSNAHVKLGIENSSSIRNYNGKIGECVDTSSTSPETTTSRW